MIQNLGPPQQQQQHPHVQHHQGGYGGGSGGGESDQFKYYEDTTVPFHTPRQPMTFDGKRMRKAISRKYVDYSSTLITSINNEKFKRVPLETQGFIPPHRAYILNTLPASFSLPSQPASCITTRFAHASTNKNKCPINVVSWTPEGRRLITGTSTGEFTLWNGMAFNFETIQQAHDSPIRAMVWSHNDTFMITAENSGKIKYWQTNMNNLKAIQGHKECIRDLSFSPTDIKFASCSDNGEVKIWDFGTCECEKVFTGHGSDVKSVDWHPYNSLVASGAKDYLVKLWDARSGANVVTLHGHKNTIFRVRWNRNGNHLLSCGRDQLIKLHDIRYMKDMYTFRGHKKEVNSLAWHPFQENLFASGGSEGSMFFWLVGNETPQGKIPNAHDGSVWDLAWHPLGHLLASGSADQTTKFWVRNRPGDEMRDKYNIFQLPEGTPAEESSKKSQQQPQQLHQQQQPQQIQGLSNVSDNKQASMNLSSTNGSKVIPGFSSGSPSTPRNLASVLTPDGEQMFYPRLQQQQQQQQQQQIPIAPPGLSIPGFTLPPPFNMAPPGVVPGLGTHSSKQENEK